ncbi:SGNH/GDSL hydrolase family protein [Ruficoccus sp. ZRK36]|uniref:SGNH/GDSL hydrolase family protein n=1 Tax=Ruficoccus sp. ZRK36 TaxID=2866311 RepID=UPI001C73BEAC|nr:SGNH/GDSL hydrolase family protein [Ruficoccus sp. ZRK36]QYY34886.1 hypothetical protein K0V07_11295 [Ruficoccus sp. ZRK36]
MFARASTTRTAFKTCLVGLFIALASPALFAEVIPANDPGFTYYGRVDAGDPQAPAIMWSGTYVEFGVEDASSLRLILDDSKGQNYFDVIVNGDEANMQVIDCVKGKHSYEVNLPTTTSRVTVFKRTEYTQGTTLFEGIDLPEGAKMLPPAPAPSRRIEFFGDSITCGMGNLAPDNAKDGNIDEKDNYLAYGAMTARNLDADYRCISRSGIGIIKSWYPLVMPELYNRLDPNDPSSRWDFTQWTPDVVVINLFQNDSWLLARMEPGTAPGPEAIVQAYKDFVGSIRKEYPQAHIVCALGSMDATREGSPWPGYIEEAVAQMNAAGDKNVSVCFFPFDGFSKHPRVKHHHRNAEILTDHIRQQTGW